MTLHNVPIYFDSYSLEKYSKNLNANISNAHFVAIFLTIG